MTLPINTRVAYTAAYVFALDCRASMASARGTVVAQPKGLDPERFGVVLWDGELAPCHVSWSAVQPTVNPSRVIPCRPCNGSGFYLYNNKPCKSCQGTGVRNGKARKADHDNDQ